jgi:hypothetical protein
MSRQLATQVKNSCPVCDSQTELAFTTEVLRKYRANYNVCSNCGYLFAEDPRWLTEAYTSAIASTDTGLVRRNISISAKLACILYFCLSERGDGRYVDIAGGYGMLTRLMRDCGFNFFWQDKYCSNLLAQGFEYSKEDGACRAVSAFEVLEHVTDPVEFVKGAMAEAGADTIIFSTVLYEGTPPDPASWWYYGFSTGQHIGFFQRKTLKVIALALDLNFYSTNKIHIFSKRKISERLMRFVTKNITSLVASHYVRFRLGSKSQTDRDLRITHIR